MSISTRAAVEKLARDAVLDPRALARERDQVALAAAARRASDLLTIPPVIVCAASLVTWALLFLCLRENLFPQGTAPVTIAVISVAILAALRERMDRYWRAQEAVERAWCDGRYPIRPVRLGTVRLEVETWFDEDGATFARDVQVREHNLAPVAAVRLADHFVENTHRVEDAFFEAYASRRDRIASATVLVDLTIASRGDELIAEAARVTGDEGMVFHADRMRGASFDGDLPDLVDHALADLGESVR